MADTRVWVNILDILWPVGSLYYCIDGEESNPAATLGGYWTQKAGASLTVGGITYVCYTRLA
jgi:hypothetical protein